MEDNTPADGKTDAIKEMVKRFLAWPLPGSVCVDLSATRPWALHRTGSTLLTEDEARQMIEHVIVDGMAQSSPTQPQEPNALAIGEAIHAAAAAIYFNDSSDYETALWSVVRQLAPGIAELLEKNPSAAWHQTQARRDAAARGVKTCDGDRK